MTNKTQNYFERAISKVLSKTADTFPVTVLTGPRQSGKTTLLKSQFPDRAYINLEDPDRFLLISSDIRGFFQDSNKRWIIDEAQRLPELFSYIQGFVDEAPGAGRFIVSGSQNFLLSEKISQTLAGRAAILELLPLMYSEFKSHPNLKQMGIWEYLYHGSYPRPYQESLDPTLWFNSYIRTYLERDVRSLVNVKDLNTFQRFLKLCAGRHGQLLNLNQLANDAGISQTTATNWLNILEASYIAFRLQPFHTNFNKRITKTSKLYFYDSAIVCQLLGIESSEHLQFHAQRGAIFEGYVISEIIKLFFSQGKKAPVYFWRDQLGTEIDLIIEQADKVIAVEIKSNATFDSSYLKNLQRWKKTVGDTLIKSFIVYSGDHNEIYGDIQIKGWKFVADLK